MDEAVDSFWEHEWDKHGTCAYEAKQVSSEFDYFNSTLQLHWTYPVRKKKQMIQAFVYVKIVIIKTKKKNTVPRTKLAKTNKIIFKFFWIVFLYLFFR